MLQIIRMCFICSQAKGFGTDIATIIGESKTPALELNQNQFSTPPTPLTGSNQNKYTFNIVGLDQTSSLYDGIYLNSIKGIEYISSKFKWKGTIDFVAKYEDNPPSTWNATDPKNIRSDRGFGGYGNSNEALYEITTGTDRYTGITGWDDTLYQLDYDVGSFIFPSPYSSTKLYNYTSEVFIDPNPIAEDDSSIPAGTHDYFSIFLHECFHTMGMGPGNTTFTDLIIESNGKDYFTGESSVATYGEYLEIVDNKSHYRLNAKNGQAYDLMGSTIGYPLYEENRWTITNLDQAIFGDLGLGIVLDGDNTNENFIGGLGDDIINTFGGDDVIKGRSGDDIINGGDGSDKFILSGPKNYYTVRKIDDNKYKIIDNISNDGSDEVTSIETLEFSDQILILDQAPVVATETTGFTKGTKYTLNGIKDYDGNSHGSLGDAPVDLINGYKYQGTLDVNNDGTKEAVYTNQISGRWVTASIDPITGVFDYSKHGQGGTTRIVGIYIDPLVTSGDVVQGSDHDSQRRFQNDLKTDNLQLKVVGDFDSDGSQEIYWKTVDGTAYLRSLMHADGNIKYANYQSLDQMTNYLTSNGFADTVALIA